MHLVDERNATISVHLIYPSLLAQLAIAGIVRLGCIGNGVEVETTGTSEWQEVRLKSLLDKARVTSQTQGVLLHAANGYSDSFTIERAMKENIMAAYRMNRVPLSLGHRFFVRMIKPEHFGLKHDP